ncbi:MAG: phage tail protein [Oscillatoriaceae cyanobacterium Prado104]|jgi:phage tail-like protein|nr:phage tail protein [Oscillatoriaceae cyanobacterium Prado104]
MSGNSSDYLKYLPAILQDDEVIDRFLLAFEKILTGEDFPSQTNPGILDSSISDPPGLEAVIGSIHTYFNPDLTPEEFLPWLASWIALSLRDDWQPATKREFIKKIVPLYRLRGTQDGLAQVLSLYLKSVKLPENVTIYEEDYFPDYYFQVELRLPKLDSSRYWQQVRIAKAIIDQEKPAHTYYGLKIQVPSMQITGNVYAVQIKPIDFVPSDGFQVTYKIAVTISRTKNENNNLRLSIKGGLGKVKVYNSQVGTGNLEVSYTLNEEEIKTVKDWYVAIDNLSDRDATGSISIATTYSESNTQNKSQIKSETQPNQDRFSLPPGLKIFTKQGDKYIDGNTFLGTEGIETNK